MPRPLSSTSGLVWSLALAVLLTAFATNSDWGGDRDTPRGDGQYRPVLARGDGHMLYLMTLSLALDGDLTFDDELAAFGDPWRQPRTATGRKMIPHPVGPALVSAPALGAAHGLAKIANAAGADIPEHGYTMFHQRLVFVLSPVFALLAAWFGAFAARRLGCERWASLVAGLAVLFGTSLTYYATYMPSYAHAMDAFASAAVVAYWVHTRGRDDWRRHLIFGALLGAAALVRVTNIAWGAAYAIELVSRAYADRARAARILAGGLVAVGAALAAFTPQLVAWKVVFGEWVTSPMGPAFVRLQHSQWVEVLFSSRNGWLSTHPVAYLGAVGLLLAPRGHRTIAAGLAVAVFVMVWVNGAAGDWWAGASFGNRRLNSATVALVIGLAWLFTRAAGWTARAPRWARQGGLALALGWLLAWNLVGVAGLREGRAANSRTRPCCAFAGAFGRVAQPVYDAVGNPFSYPASLVFALSHGVHPKRWDSAVGSFADRPPLDRHNAGTYRGAVDTWNLAGVHIGPWLLDGWSERRMHGPGRVRPVAYRVAASGARFLLPLWMPDGRAFDVRLVPELIPDGSRPQLDLWIDGESVGRADVDLVAGTASVAVERGRLGVGMHEVELRWLDAPGGEMPVRDLKLRYVEATSRRR